MFVLSPTAFLKPTPPSFFFTARSIETEQRWRLIYTKQTLALRLRTHAPLNLTLNTTHPLLLSPLTTLRTLLNQSLDMVAITRWTGDRHSAPFISSQLHLLHSLLLEAISVLKGPNLLTPVHSAESGTSTPNMIPPPPGQAWFESPPDPETFSPPLPPTLSLHLTLLDSTLLLTLRVLESAATQPTPISRFALAIGAQRRLEHDEMDEVFLYRGEEVRVREKVRVEGSADPSLLSLGAKLGALERTVAERRKGLEVLMGVGEESEED
jgi:hypothetical protein